MIHRMNPDYDKQLEAAVQRELESLPELVAPPSLTPRVLRVIEQRAQRPWYRRSWQSWPFVWQAASFAVLLALFGGLCLAGRDLGQSAGATAALHEAAGWIAGLNLIENTFNVLASAALLAVKKLGMGVIIASLVMAGLGYALFVGLGTLYFRIAFSKREESTL